MPSRDRRRAAARGGTVGVVGRSPMGTVRAEAEREVAGRASDVYGYIADMREHHPRFLPPAFSDFTVETGGVGAHTTVSFTTTAGGRSRSYHMAVTEPEPGRVLAESDTGSSLVTTFTVTPAGEHCRVRITTTWQGAGGIGGFFEKLFAPAALRRIYVDELARLDAYARQQPPTGSA